MPTVSQPEQHSAGSLRNVADRLEKIGAQLKSIADELERQQIAEIECGYQKSLQRAFKDLLRWSGAVHESLFDALDAHGAYRAAKEKRGNER